MLFYDQRCARELDLIFTLFDQFRRHNVNNQVSFKIDQNTEEYKELIETMNDINFTEKLNEMMNISNDQYNEIRSCTKNCDLRMVMI